MALFGNNDSESKGFHITNQFMEGTIIHGDVKAANDIRIDGLIVGTVEASAKLVIGKTGKIEGDIKCASADIEGRIVGRLEVKDLLILKATAVIDGDITVNKLVVEQGARFNGKCTMGGIKEIKNEKPLATAATLKKEAV